MASHSRLHGICTARSSTIVVANASRRRQIIENIMTVAIQPQRSFRLDGRPLAVAQRIALANSFMLPGFDVGLVPGVHDGINGCVDVWMFDRLTAAKNIQMTCRFRRTLGILEKDAADGRDDIAFRLRLITAGEADGIMDGEPIKVRTGDILFHANDISFALDVVDVDCLTFGLPAALIGFDAARHRNYAVFDAASEEAAILASVFTAFFDRIETASPAEADALAHPCIAMFSGLARLVERKDGARSTDRGAEMRIFIDGNLADPNLGLARLQDEFPASRAVIYRAFRSEGGVLNYIARRRMRRALALLTLSNEEQSIGEVAEAVGYETQRRFSRAFTRHFGVSPSEARASFVHLTMSHAEKDIAIEAEGLRLRAMLGHSETG